MDAIDVVLAGDTFDWLVSREWTGDVRPWHAGRRAAAARERVVLGAMGRGHRLLATLAGWMRRGIEVPAADRRGRPMPTDLRPVPVRVAVLCGDRDRWLDQAVAGWMLSPGAPLPMIGASWSDGDVVVRHGDDMDPLAAACGSEPTLGESLAVDLIARFGSTLDDLAGVGPLAAGLVRQLAGGRIVDAPTRLTGWLSAHEGRGTVSEAARQTILDAWHRSVGLWHRAARRLPSAGAAGVDLVDTLADSLDRIAEGEEPRLRAWLDATPGGGMPLPVAATTVVLGHPAADAASSAARRGQVVCLGPGALHAGDHLSDHSGVPGAVLVHPTRECRPIEWLPLAPGPIRVGWQDDENLVRGVWLSASPHAFAGVVDAA